MTKFTAIARTDRKLRGFSLIEMVIALSILTVVLAVVVAGISQTVHRNTAETNLADYGIQLSRGFRALKVWLSINTFGLAAFRDAITRGFELAEFAERELRSRPICEIVSPASMAIVAFRFGNDDALQTRLVDAMLEDGFAFLTSTTLKGRTALRFCTIGKYAGTK